jgi:hypothetical protein
MKPPALIFNGFDKSAAGLLNKKATYFCIKMVCLRSGPTETIDTGVCTAFSIN